MGWKRRALSLRDSRRIFEEMKRPPEDTPGRREMFEHVRAMAAMREKLGIGFDLRGPAG